MTMRTALVRVRGKVQGVWFRGWTEERARELGLAGWVRNRADGSVEALFSGTEAAVEQMLEDCRHGPPAAAVAAVEVEDAAPVAGTGFRLRETL